jgi:hypothetical protein
MDELDQACAMHDSCIVNHPQPADLHCTSFVNCPCDCALVKVRVNGSLIHSSELPIDSWVFHPLPADRVVLLCRG